MANIEESGKSRTIAVEPNIVPFIDLMSVLIIFLLITAVWSQVSMIQLGSSIYGKRTGVPVSPTPPKAEIPFRLDVIETGYRVVIGRTKYLIENRDNKYDEPRLVEYLKTIKETYPDKTDAMITILDHLPYGDLIRGMDALMGAGFNDLSVANVGVE